MEYRHLGNSGVIVSEIAYGNWLTHGSQVEEEAAAACVPLSTWASRRSTPLTSVPEPTEQGQRALGGGSAPVAKGLLQVGGQDRGLNPALHAQFGQQTGDVVLDGLLRQVELPADLAVGQAVADQSQDVPLAR